MKYANEFPADLIESCEQHAYENAIGYTVRANYVRAAVLATLHECDVYFRTMQLRERDALIAKMRSALIEARNLGMKVYHNANAHQAAKDWATVKRLIDSALGDELSGDE